MTLLYDSRDEYFQDHRRCYWCNNLIKLREEYDYVTVGPEYLKIYFCEKCLEIHPMEEAILKSPLSGLNRSSEQEDE